MATIRALARTLVRYLMVAILLPFFQSIYKKAGTRP